MFYVDCLFLPFAQVFRFIVACMITHAGSAIAIWCLEPRHRDLKALPGIHTHQRFR